MATTRTVLVAPASFDLRETVMSHGWREVVPFAWDGERLARRDPEGLARVVQEPLGPVVVEHDEADPGAPQRMATVLNLEMDLAAFHAACSLLPTLSWAAERGAGRLLRGIDAWEDSCKALCFTNIAWPQAVRCIDRLAQACAFGWWPSPEEVLDRGEGWLREHCRIGYRAPFLVRLAAGFAEGRFSRRSRTRRDFLAMPGIGPSTAAYLAGLWGCWDAISFDSSIAWLLRERDGIAKPTRQDAEAKYAAFGDLRGLACLVDLHGFVRGFSAAGGRLAGAESKRPDGAAAGSKQAGSRKRAAT